MLILGIDISFESTCLSVIAWKLSGRCFISIRAIKSDLVQSLSKVDPNFAKTTFKMGQLTMELAIQIKRKMRHSPFYRKAMSHFSYSSLSDLVDHFDRVGFSGSRHVGSSGYVGAESVLPYLSGYTGNVGVGCARGVDALVRAHFIHARIFSVRWPLSCAAFAQRSARLVGWVADGGGLFIVFPSVACPAGVVPSVRFRGYGSGSWGAAALAVGLGCSVLIFIPDVLGLEFPAGELLSSRFHLLGISPCGGSCWLSSGG